MRIEDTPLITQTTEYALRAVVFLAMSNGEAQTTAQIADGTMVPMAYLSKVLQSLSRAGIVASQRGLGGGFTLLVDPEEVSVLEIVDIVDPIHRINCCPTGQHKRLCALHQSLDNAMEMVETSLSKASIQQLIDTPSNVGLCTVKKRKKAVAGKRR